MRNPLQKRILRELRGEIAKYLVILLLMAGSIGFISGFDVADGSMISAYKNSFSLYSIEDGHFRIQKRVNAAQRKEMEALDISVYENFYIEESLTNDSTLRIFQNRSQVNRACLMEGSFPARAGEIAIDRMYADNNGLTVGDVLDSETRHWTVTGLVALSDYSTLFRSNNDSMFDSVKFGVAVVSEEEFAAYPEEELLFGYAWRYDTPPANEADEHDTAEELMKELNHIVRLKEFVPRYANKAITFAGDDMGKDGAMMPILLYIVIAILAFVFAITTASTIQKEANVIGVLRASGYTKEELIRHYMAVPMLVTVISALVGNVLGYTVMKEVCVGMYYGSYSLPTYVTIWNANAFLKTTVVPTLLMALINYALLRRKLRLPPLNFLRRDLSRKRNRRALPLSNRLPFMTRFRVRIMAQNLGSYVTILVGVLFANLLLMFGLLFPAVLDHYQQTIPEGLLANYQYFLTVPDDMLNEERKLESLFSGLVFASEVETDNKTAEKFSAYALNTLGGDYPVEEVALYGIEPDSRYVRTDLSGEGVILSSAYADKQQLSLGDTITLKEPYEDTTYTFTVDGFYDYDAALCVFMSRERLNECFDYEDDFFCGYFSDTEITDIDSKYIGNVIDLDEVTKISRQLIVSMGDMMALVDGFAVVMFVILIYLLSKTIIEKNAQSISMAKILGYSNIEIARLYLLSTSLVVLGCLLVSLPIEDLIMRILFREVLIQMISGWIPYYLDPKIPVEMFLLGAFSYLLVAALEFRRIRSVPMDEALKNVE